MAVIPVPQPRIDADLTTPVEVEGSPIITVDEVTYSLHIRRLYAVLAASWQKLGYAAPDPQFPGARLVNETQDRRFGPVLWFSRYYSEIPQPRVDTRQVAFTLPGRSAITISKRTAGVIGWNQYGAAAPQTVPKDATVQYSYAAAVSIAQNPKTLFFVTPESALTYQGARVDYSGSVYVSVGDVTIPQAPTEAPIVEPRWQLQGTVGGFFSGQDWVISDQITRWRGPIFQKEKVFIPNFILP
jgi:hypothetical protein